jgi:tetratricopeptide (TPR) repeat protein
MNCRNVSRLNVKRVRAGLCVSVLYVLALGTAGCGSMQTVNAEPEPIPTAQPAPAPVAVTAMPVRSTPTGEIELQVWNDPAFQRQFAESFMSETDIEPRTADDVREKMQGVMKLLSDGKTDEAAALLDKYRKEPIVRPVEKVEEKKKSLVATIVDYAERRGKPTKAQQEKPRTVADEPATAVYDFTLGNIYFPELDKQDLAAAAYREAVRKYPRFRRAWENLGIVLVRQKQFDEALGALNHVVELGGGKAITYGLMGYSYSCTGNSVSAESAYRMAILLDPVSTDWQMGLARSLLRGGRFADVVALTAQLIASHPEKIDLWSWQASAYLGLNQPMKAAQNYEMLDRLGHATYENLCTLGDIYINEDNFDVAVNAYGRVLARSPQSSPDRAVRAAKVMAARGAMPQAKALVEQIEGLKSDQVRLADQDRKDLLRLHARIAVSEGAGEEEAKDLEKIVELDPLDGDALIQLGQYYNRSKNSEKAIFYYERAAKIPNFEADAKVRHAQVLVGLSKYAEALPLLESAQQIKYRENVQTYKDQVARLVGRGER